MQAAAQISCQEIAPPDGGHRAKLEQLRVEARGKGLDWLQAALVDAKRDEVCQLVQAADLQVRSGGAWMPVAELREALVKHLAPKAMWVSKDLCQTRKRPAATALL